MKRIMFGVYARSVANERPWMIEKLSLLGLRVIPGQANYLLFQCPVPLLRPLRKKGILLRSCGNYPGLSDDWYRTAVRTHKENERLLAGDRGGASMKQTRCIMVQGTMSGAGKSLLCAGCAAFLPRMDTGWRRLKAKIWP